MKITTSLLLFIFFIACKPSYEETIVSLENYKVEDGFQLKAIAAEPLLKAPVAMDFDDAGRIWVAEMPSYMSNLEGRGETDATGSIKILEDLDNDGIMDHAKIFLDSLVLPRALAHVYGGLLYAEPPYLYFVEIKDDKPYNRVVVDSLYASQGNPEHQPNGLLLNIDNWIYNAKSNFRYRKKNGIWLKEPTTFRGQWGITHDNFGRLYYNDNSRQLLGDHVLPNRLTRNEFFAPNKSVDELLTKDQRVYPLKKSLVNRGYADGILNRDSMLVNVTAACSPLVYRGAIFLKEYNENVFVCIPEVNGIKRNILTFHGDSTSARQAWEGKEFLSSEDDGFRPVSLYNSPDGSMFIVDMHRGVIGHHAYLSPYFKKKVKETQIDTIVDYGRILKVFPVEEKLAPIPELNSANNEDLMKLLSHSNGWVRDRAQHLLLTRGDKEIIPELKDLVKNSEKPLVQLHTLYVLEDFDALSFELLIHVAQESNAQVTAHAIVLLEKYVSLAHSEAVGKLFDQLLRRDNATINLYLSSTIGRWFSTSEAIFKPILDELSTSYTTNIVQREAFLSGLNPTQDFDYILPVVNLDEDLKVLKENILAGNKNPIYTSKTLSEDNRTTGARLFRQICAACHGINGDGIEGLAPPLNKSEYMEKPLERLGLILLHGLSGPVHVNGKLYEINQAMPGLIANESITDQDISDIISYVTNAFSDTPRGLSFEKIRELRLKKSKGGGEFTEEELLELFP
ncbi:c-type cytochrome [Maribacter sp. 2210JD10-5]|uniref:DUF7133 domain-containing protein n=1 Tax=Maribacter sp. 2210JD10-5 TaxID=3386272 RepID=UPI0039BC71ED